MTNYLLIFGGSGFVGQALCKEAIKQNISVVSISKHGQPSNFEDWTKSPLITWISADIFAETDWKKYMKNAFCCVNLVGILLENKKKGITYEKMIVQSNKLISHLADMCNCPYIFLSAQGGPKNYLSAKKQAESDLAHLTIPTVIIRAGFIVTRESPLRYAQGILIKIGSKIPFMNHFATTVYPTPLDKLVKAILIEAKNPTHQIIQNIR